MPLTIWNHGLMKNIHLKGDKHAKLSFKVLLKSKPRFNNIHMQIVPAKMLSFKNKNSMLSKQCP